jgi:hypothetical protein
VSRRCEAAYPRARRFAVSETELEQLFYFYRELALAEGLTPARAVLLLPPAADQPVRTLVRCTHARITVPLTFGLWCGVARADVR